MGSVRRLLDDVGVEKSVQGGGEAGGDPVHEVARHRRIGVVDKEDEFLGALV